MAHPIENYLPRAEEHFADLYQGNRQHACAAATMDELGDWQQTARPALVRLIGLDRMRRQLATFEPSINVINSIDCGNHTREAAYLQAEPTVQLPVWILRPKGRGPFPLAITPHGHGEFGRYVGLADSAEERKAICDSDNDVALQAVERGFFTIAMGTRGLCPGRHEQVSRHFKSPCHSHWGRSLLAGRTSIGERVWDATQLMNWALEREDVDDRRVLMIGNSGGGQVTLYTAAIDPRVSAAVPNCSFAPLVSASGEISHCVCNLVPGIFTFGDYPDIAALIAPRPLCFVHGKNDACFTADDVEAAVAPVASLYERVNAAHRFTHRWGDGGHRFYKQLHWPFVDNHLTAS